MNTHIHTHTHIDHASSLFSKLIRPMFNRLLGLMNRAIEKKEGQQEKLERDKRPEKNEQTGLSLSLAPLWRLKAFLGRVAHTLAGIFLRKFSKYLSFS